MIFKYLMWVNLINVEPKDFRYYDFYDCPKKGQLIEYNETVGTKTSIYAVRLNCAHTTEVIWLKEFQLQPAKEPQK